MIPRKFMFAAVACFLCMMIMTMTSIQWSNYVNDRSSQRLCKVVTLFVKSYKMTPPTTKLGKEIAAAMLQLQTDLSCKIT